MTPLRRRMIEDMRVRNLAPHTQRAYVEQISRFARHFGKSPELLGPADIRAYQLYLIQDRRLAASSILVAVAAIRFLYKATLNPCQRDFERPRGDWQLSLTKRFGMAFKEDARAPAFSPMIASGYT